MPVKPKAVIFDLDGVITDTSPLHFQSWTTIANELNVDLSKLNPVDFIGLPREECLEIILKIGKKKMNKQEKSELLEKKNGIYFELLQNTELKKFMTVINLIKSLRSEGVLIGLASISKNARFILQKLEIENLFDYIADLKNILNLKPAPDIFLDVANHFNLKTSECWGIEDSLVGIQSVNAANIFSIGIGSHLNEIANINFENHEAISIEKIYMEYNEYLEKPVLELIDVNKIYSNGVQSIFNFNLKIKRNEFITFIGPSGCGKTTTLRMIAGLEEISSGSLLIKNTPSNNIPSKNRDIAMVFQNYALYPHMTVKQNIDFGLRIKKVNKQTIEKKLSWAEQVLDLKNYMNRRPKELSGGQRQRVALGRAIVRDAKIFLMDEPLANLDAKLRQKMRKEIKKLHNKLGVNTIYVTHDQTEAMTMSDRVVVMNEGLIQQIGTPFEIYNSPSNVFVAKFIGDAEINLLEFTLTKGSFENYNINFFNIVKSLQEKLRSYEGKKLILGVRPEDIQIGKESVVGLTYPETLINSEIVFIENLGSKQLIHTVTKFGDEISVEADKHFKGQIGEQLDLFINLNRVHFFDKDSGFNVSIKTNIETNAALKTIEMSKRDYLSNKLILAQRSKTKKTLFSQFVSLFKKKTEKVLDEQEQRLLDILTEIRKVEEKGEKINND